MKPGAYHVSSIDRKALRRAEMTLSKLRYHFPRALPQVVEDVDDWLARMDGLLEILKGAIHGQGRMDVDPLLWASPRSARWSKRWEGLRRARPGLVPLLNALAFTELTGRGCCNPSVLDWVELHAESLLRLLPRQGLAPLMSLCALRDDMDASGLSLLFDLWGDASFGMIPWDSVYRDYLIYLVDEARKWPGGKPVDIPPRPKAVTMGEPVEGFLRDLLAMKPKDRQGALRLMTGVLPEDLIARAKVAEQEIQDLESRLCQRLREDERGQDKRSRGFEEISPLLECLKQRHHLSRQTVEAREYCHRFYYLEDLCRGLRQVCKIADQHRLTRAWISFLGCIPSRQRLRLFLDWEAEVRFSDWRGYHVRIDRQFGQFLKGMAQLFARRGVHEGLLQHWLNSDCMDNLFDDEQDTIPIIKSWIHLVEFVFYDQQLVLGDKLFASLDQFVRGAPDTHRAGKLIAALQGQEDGYYDDSAIRAMFAISPEDAHWVPILKKLDDDYELGELVQFVGTHLQDQRLRGNIAIWLVHDRIKDVRQLLLYLQAALQMGVTLPPLAGTKEACAWMKRYPQALQGQLGELQGITPAAEAIAARILGKEFPVPEDLEREQEAIRGRLDSAAAQQDLRLHQALKKRMDNLTHRLAHPEGVTSQRLQTLADKLSQRIDYEVAQYAMRHCHARITKCVEDRFHVQSLPKDPLESPMDQLFLGMLQLSDPMKELGLSLLCKSWVDPTCDFRTEPPNVAFMEAMGQRGVNLDPWLDPSFQQTATDAKGEPYRLYFTRHIEDVLLMGFHFDTCLSPDGVNFFSTLANAMDINKQVLYARTDSGRVIGRCLFALTDQGSLLTYHRYAHDPKDGFAEQVDLLARSLAQAMNTVVADSGKVATLVAKKWYDDGAVFVRSIFDLDNENGTVRSLLRTEVPANIIEKLLATLGSEDMLKSLLGSILFLEAFKERRDLVRAFLEPYAFDTSVAFSVRFRLAVLAQQAGYNDEARNIIRSLRLNALPRQLKRYYCEYRRCGFHGIGQLGEVIDLLIACNPSIALRTLRATRPHGINDDADEKKPARVKALKHCYRALGRPCHDIVHKSETS